MQKQGLLEKFIYCVIGVIFFIGYYFLMIDVFKLNPFKGIATIPTIYFALAILLFPKSGDVLSRMIDNRIINSNIIVPVAYIFAPLIYIYSLKKRADK